ncbi:hypothetical protein DFQ26_003014 [Actinomortierella ambigua]|nr:hypothetical protein DFQ26_003014 [Actinomortierella ambigua]
MIVQFGSYTSHASSIESNGTFRNSHYLQGLGFNSRRLFGLVGSIGSTNMFTAFTNQTNSVTHSRWTGLRLDFDDYTKSLASQIYPYYS